MHQEGSERCEEPPQQKQTVSVRSAQAVANVLENKVELWSPWKSTVPSGMLEAADADARVPNPRMKSGWRGSFLPPPAAQSGCCVFMAEEGAFQQRRSGMCVKPPAQNGSLCSF